MWLHSAMDTTDVVLHKIAYTQASTSPTNHVHKEQSQMFTKRLIFWCKEEYIWKAAKFSIVAGFLKIYLLQFPIMIEKKKSYSKLKQTGKDAMECVSVTFNKYSSLI